MPPELLQPFDMSLLEPTEKIPDGNASSMAVLNYVTRVLQTMIGESNLFKHQLMWGSKIPLMASSLCVSAVSTRLKGYTSNVLQRDLEAGGKWRTVNTPLCSRTCIVASLIQSRCTSSCMPQISRIFHWVATSNSGLSSLQHGHGPENHFVQAKFPDFGGPQHWGLPGDQVHQLRVWRAHQPQVVLLLSSFHQPKLQWQHPHHLSLSLTTHHASQRRQFPSSQQLQHRPWHCLCPSHQRQSQLPVHRQLRCQNQHHCPRHQPCLGRRSALNSQYQCSSSRPSCKSRLWRLTNQQIRQHWLRQWLTACPAVRPQSRLSNEHGTLARLRSNAELQWPSLPGRPNCNATSFLPLNRDFLSHPYQEQHHWPHCTRLKWSVWLILRRVSGHRQRVTTLLPQRSEPMMPDLMHWIRMPAALKALIGPRGWTTRRTTSTELVGSSKQHRSPESCHETRSVLYARDLRSFVVVFCPHERTSVSLQGS